jgi:hypothetical protein
MGWDVLPVIISAVSASGLITLAIVAKREMGEADRVRNMQAYALVLEQLGEEQEREARRYVIKQFPKGKKTLDDLPDSERIKVENVLSGFDRIGFLVSKGFYPANYIADFIGLPILRCWDKLSDYAHQRRQEDEKETQIKSTYVQYFEALVEIIRQYFKDTGRINA